MILNLFVSVFMHWPTSKCVQISKKNGKEFYSNAMHGLVNPIQFCENSIKITMNDLNIKLPDILFNELDGAAFNQACEFCSSFA